MILLEKQIDDYWNVDGQRELSDAWTGFTRFTLLNERPPEGYKWSRRERQTALCETFKISCLMGKLNTRDVLENHLKDRSFRLIHWLSIPYLCERAVKNSSIWKESLTWIVPWIRFIRGVNSEG